MKNEKVENVIKTSLKVSFSIGYWFVMGMFILIGAAKDAALGIVLFLLFGFSFWFIFKMVRFILRFGRNKTEKAA